MAGLLERSRIPLWIIPEEFIPEAARRQGVSPRELEVERDGMPGVLLSTGVGEKVMKEAVALWAAARSPLDVIPFGMLTQDRALWCWAAVALSVGRHYLTEQSAIDQCELVNDVLEEDFCCGPQADLVVCNKDKPLQGPLTKAGVTHDPGPVPAELDDVQPKIEDGRILCLRVEWANNGMGHFAVITGWLDGEKPSLYIEDPSGFSDWVELDELRDGLYRDQTCIWTDTYFTDRAPSRIRVPDAVWNRVLATSGASSDVLVDGGVR